MSGTYQRGTTWGGEGTTWVNVVRAPACVALGKGPAERDLPSGSASVSRALHSCACFPFLPALTYFRCWGSGGARGARALGQVPARQRTRCPAFQLTAPRDV